MGAVNKTADWCCCWCCYFSVSQELNGSVGRLVMDEVCLMHPDNILTKCYHLSSQACTAEWKNPNCDFHALWSLKWTDIEMQPSVIPIGFHDSHRLFKSTWVHLNHLVTQLLSITFYFSGTSSHPGAFFSSFLTCFTIRRETTDSSWVSMKQPRQRKNSVGRNLEQNHIQKK